MRRRGRHRMVVGFTTYATSGYLHWCYGFDSRSGRGVQHYVIKFVSDWFSPVPPVSSTNKTVRHDITEILLKVTLNTITITLYPIYHNTNVMTLAIIFILWCSVNISDIYKIIFNYLIVNSSYCLTVLCVIIGELFSDLDNHWENLHFWYYSVYVYILYMSIHLISAN